MNGMNAGHETANQPQRQPEMRAPAVLLDVALTPAPLEGGGIAGRDTRFVVVDVIRATTTLSVVFEHGARAVYATRDIASARQVQRERIPTARLAGERGGLPPEGFDFGNSPAEMTEEKCAGRELVFATTNGTRALAACTHVAGARIFTGAFRNGQAVAEVCLAEAPARATADPQPQTSRPSAEQSELTGQGERASEAQVGATPADVVVVCSGRGDRPAYDDTLCAGYLIETMIAEAERLRRPVRLAEGARIAQATWLAFAAGHATSTPSQRSGALQQALAASDAGQATISVGLRGDLAWCAEINATRLVPGVLRIEQEPLSLMLAAHTPEQWHAMSASV